MDTIGEPLRTVKTAKEFVAVICDAMQCHYAIVDKCNILHRDISDNNILVVRMKDGTVRGLLIDFDCAIDISKDKTEVRGEMTGTFPFMSLNNLTCSTVPRTSLDDWESVLYLLCWYATIGFGTGEDRSEVRARLKNQPIARWRNGTLDTIVDAKRSNLRSLENFYHDIVRWFDERDKNSEQLGVFALRLYKVLFANKLGTGYHGSEEKKVNPIMTALLNDQPPPTSVSADSTNVMGPFALRAEKWEDISKDLLGVINDTKMEMAGCNTVKIIGNSVDIDTSQYSKSPRLRKFYRSTHFFARELDIIVNKSDIFAGRSLDALSCTTFDGCAFPLARKLKFSFCVSYEQKMAWYSRQKERQQQNLVESTQPQLQLQNYDAAASAATINANISAFVKRIKEMTPKVREIEVVGGSAFVDQSPDTEHFVSLVARLFRLATRIAYKFDDGTKPLDLRVDTISNLVYIDIMADSIDPIAQLARQSAGTLQSLCIKTHGRGDISGLIQSAHGDYVEYSQLRVLRLNHCSDFNDDDRLVFPGAAPFPYLRLFSIASTYPFADDVVFRRNAATLEYLDIRLERDMALLLMAYNVFTRTSHPRLQYVKTRIARGFGAGMPITVEKLILEKSWRVQC
ncbi:hypothetical protein IW146_002515 [Coemansia sp. RSA 922]|nr:hypothetical protein IW146_002515 [Coemansia sp. RSA 922]